MDKAIRKPTLSQASDDRAAVSPIEKRASFGQIALLKVREVVYRCEGQGTLPPQMRRSNRKIGNAPIRRAARGSSSSKGDGNIASGCPADNEATAAVFRAIRLQGWSGLRLPRELQVGVYAFVNPVWCLKPPLPSPLSGAVLQYHTEVVIDYSNRRQRTFWESMAPQTAYELGKQMINLRCLIHRFPETPDGAQGLRAGQYVPAYGWCLGIVIGLVEGHVKGRQAAREEEGSATTMKEGSLQSLVFQGVVISTLGRQEAARLHRIINSAALAAAPSRFVDLPALTDVIGVIHSGDPYTQSVIKERNWAMTALQCLSRVNTDNVANLWPFVMVTRSLVELSAMHPMAPSQLVTLLGCILPGMEPESTGHLAYLRVIGSIKLYGIESADLRNGIRDMQKSLVERGCSKSLDLLAFRVDRSDAHSLLLNDYETFKALTSLVDATCSPSGRVVFEACISADDDVRDIPLAHLLAYTSFGKVPSCGLPILSALLTCYDLRIWPEIPPDCPSVQSYIDTTSPSTYSYVWTVTEDQVARPQNGPIDLSLMDELMFDRHEIDGVVCSISIECAEGFAPPADAIPPEPPELEALSPSGLEGVKALIVKHRIGLGVAKTILSKGAHLESLELMEMGMMDVLALLGGIPLLQMPQKLKLDSLRAQDGQIQEGPTQLDSAYELIVNKKLHGVKELTAKGDFALRLAATLRHHMPSLGTLTMSGGETEMRQLLVDGGRGAIAQLSLRFVHEGGREFIRAADESEGITLGDWSDQLPHINSLLMYLDVPPADVVDPGAFILSSIWSVLEIESISELTVVLRQRSHLDELKAALKRRFGPDRQERGLVTTSSLILSFEDIKKLNKAAFAYSLRADIGFLEALIKTGDPHQSLTMITSLAATVKRLSSIFEYYLPSHDANIAAVALASDFAGRMCAATPMSVVDPPYAPRRLKAPLMAAMERHGLAMEPMMRLHGDGPGIPSPSVIASAAQLVAVLRKTGKDITGIQLLYKASVHGFAYTDMLSRVGDASGLLFLTRMNAFIHGCFINADLRPPPSVSSSAAFKQYPAEVLIFKASGHSQPTFQTSSVTSKWVTLSRADNHPHGVEAKLTVGKDASDPCIPEWLGLWAPDTLGWSASEGCVVRVSWERGVGDGEEDINAILADEIEVFLYNDLLQGV
ncbi:unnamed protein product [Vitrella brassicaformis CCMP3155]|uniref:Uncharacterized protein n=2 Tax=Vitrella brassicaformis TaxID=1169539 RepID=A0A0G4G181_VITBC|nr:unnamed protein product [Vitrella brassicaformis CCMP3155]|eukprot:CEM21850.1 unnamed protein product [Vitrella brassicaformis CCMP3155]